MPPLYAGSAKVCFARGTLFSLDYDIVAEATLEVADEVPFVKQGFALEHAFDVDPIEEVEG